MGVLADLVAQSQPAYFGGGHASAATVGRTWLWPFENVVDSNGDPINLTTVTGVCEIVTNADVVVVTLTFTGNANGTFSLSKDEASTGVTPGKYKWRFYMDDATDEIQVWGSGNSPIDLRKA